MFTDLMPAHIVEQEAGIDGHHGRLRGRHRRWRPRRHHGCRRVLQHRLEPQPGRAEAGDHAVGQRLHDQRRGRPGQSITLVPNENYWGTGAEVVGDRDALHRPGRPGPGAAEPRGQRHRAAAATPSCSASSTGMDGVEVFTGDEFTFEHYDFNFLNPTLQNPDVRQAFALCLPRQQIVDNLIMPLNPERRGAQQPLVPRSSRRATTDTLRRRRTTRSTSRRPRRCSRAPA